MGTQHGSDHFELITLPSVLLLMMRCYKICRGCAVRWSLRVGFNFFMKMDSNNLRSNLFSAPHSILKFLVSIVESAQVDRCSLISEWSGLCNGKPVLAEIPQCYNDTGITAYIYLRASQTFYHIDPLQQDPNFHRPPRN